MQTLTNLIESVSKLTFALTMHEKGKFVVQLKPNPKSQQHPEMSNTRNQKYEPSQISYNPL